MGRKARTKREERGKGGPKSRPRPAMRRQTRWILGVLLAVLVGGSIGAWQWLPATANSAPPFNLAASTGRRIALEDYLGKQEVVLLFYMGAG